MSAMLHAVAAHTLHYWAQHGCVCLESQPHERGIQWGRLGTTSLVADLSELCPTMREILM